MRRVAVLFRTSASASRGSPRCHELSELPCSTSPSLLPSDMTTTIKPVPAEQVAEKDGLIHGLSSEELDLLCVKCVQAKATAYCECPAHCRDSVSRRRYAMRSCVQRNTTVSFYVIMLTLCLIRPVLPLPRGRIASRTSLGCKELLSIPHNRRQRRKRSLPCRNLR